MGLRGAARRMSCGARRLRRACASSACRVPRCSTSTSASPRPPFETFSGGRRARRHVCCFSTSSTALRPKGATTAPASPTAWLTSCSPSWTAWRASKGWRWLGPRHDRTSWTQLCFVQGGLTGCCCAASQALPTGLPSSRPLPNHSSWRMTSTWTLSQPLQTTSQGRTWARCCLRPSWQRHTRWWHRMLPLGGVGRGRPISPCQSSLAPTCRTLWQRRGPQCRQRRWLGCHCCMPASGAVGTPPGPPAPAPPDPDSSPPWPDEAISQSFVHIFV
mmetsp:Transcript_2985/g.8754  ORF Transcript_2985/g.8754 Transcript_2985/m.8754 type:complete len:274 (-) Transcript_2985:203-1024(-)